MAGMMAASSLVWRRDLLFVPALLAMFASGAMLVWMWRRARNMLGRPIQVSFGHLGRWSVC